MNDEAVGKQLCDERYGHMKESFEKMDKKMDTLFGRINWFYLLAISTLVGVLINLVKG